ncbi:hypothetical protein CYMTET_45947, partial [Cymbomonas tetramitiformis]
MESHVEAPSAGKVERDRFKGGVTECYVEAPSAGEVEHRRDGAGEIEHDEDKAGEAECHHDMETAGALECHVETPSAWEAEHDEDKAEVMHRQAEVPRPGRWSMVATNLGVTECHVQASSAGEAGHDSDKAEGTECHVEGTDVFKQGFEARHMIVVLTGKLQAVSEAGRMVGEMGIGSLVGERAFFELHEVDRERSVTVRAKEITSVVVFDFGALEKMKYDIPEVAIKLYLQIGRCCLVELETIITEMVSAANKSSKAMSMLVRSLHGLSIQEMLQMKSPQPVHEPDKLARLLDWCHCWCQHWRYLTKKEVEVLHQSMTYFVLSYCQPVMRSGERANYVAFILSGAVDIEVNFNLMVAQAGDFVGESGLYNSGWRGTSVRCANFGTVVGVLSYDTILTLMKSHPDLVLKVCAPMDTPLALMKSHPDLVLKVCAPRDTPLALVKSHLDLVLKSHPDLVLKLLRMFTSSAVKRLQRTIRLIHFEKGRLNPKPFPELYERFTTAFTKFFYQYFEPSGISTAVKMKLLDYFMFDRCRPGTLLHTAGMPPTHIIIVLYGE